MKQPIPDCFIIKVEGGECELQAYQVSEQKATWLYTQYHPASKCARLSLDLLHQGMVLWNVTNDQNVDFIAWDIGIDAARVMYGQVQRMPRKGH